MNMRRTLLVHLRFVLVAEPGAKSAGQFHVILRRHGGMLTMLMVKLVRCGATNVWNRYTRRFSPHIAVGSQACSVVR